MLFSMYGTRRLKILQRSPVGYKDKVRKADTQSAAEGVAYSGDHRISQVEVTQASQGSLFASSGLEYAVHA